MVPHSRTLERPTLGSVPTPIFLTLLGMTLGNAYAAYNRFVEKTQDTFLEAVNDIAYDGMHNDEDANPPAAQPNPTSPAEDTTPGASIDSHGLGIRLYRPRLHPIDGAVHVGHVDRPLWRRRLGFLPCRTAQVQCLAAWTLEKLQAVCKQRVEIVGIIFPVPSTCFTPA